MVPLSEIRQLSSIWNVPHSTIEKDHALGHLLAAINLHFEEQLRFKGGTCLRKCYFPDYRFSEDMDFSSVRPDFLLSPSDLRLICKTAEEHSGIRYTPEPIQALQHKDIRKGDQVRIKYWGANHSRNEPPPAPERWLTKIKLEISTEEVLLLDEDNRSIYHPYTDTLIAEKPISCYAIDEIIAEKLRSLIQRKYTASRDYFDLFNLTDGFSAADWSRIKLLFLEKMDHKGLKYEGPGQLVPPASIENVSKNWEQTIGHQISNGSAIPSTQLINEVRQRILEHL